MQLVSHVFIGKVEPYITCSCITFHLKTVLLIPIKVFQLKKSYIYRCVFIPYGETDKSGPPVPCSLERCYVSIKLFSNWAMTMCWFWQWFHAGGRSSEAHSKQRTTNFMILSCSWTIQERRTLICSTGDVTDLTIQSHDWLRLCQFSRGPLRFQQTTVLSSLTIQCYSPSLSQAESKMGDNIN